MADSSSGGDAAELGQQQLDEEVADNGSVKRQCSESDELEQPEKKPRIPLEAALSEGEATDPCVSTGDSLYETADSEATPPRPLKTIMKFKMPSNIVAKNKATALLSETGKKKKKKPFKGLSYSFIKKKKKKTGKPFPGSVARKANTTPTPEVTDTEPAPVQSSEAAEEEDILMPIMHEVDEDAVKENILKGKARKSIPHVVLKKSFIPSMVREVPMDSPDGSVSDPEASLGDEDTEGSVASSVKLRRSSVSGAGGDSAGPSRSDSADGSVTGASGAGEAAPPEGTVPSRMVDPLLASIGCKCQEPRTPIADIDPVREDFFCQGIDAIDGRLVGCCNAVLQRRMVRPSCKVPFQLMCALHRERLRRHHCCPGCGIFCTQGIFLRCTAAAADTPHMFHKKCAYRAGDMLVCVHCGDSDTANLRTVQLTIRTGRTPTFYHRQGVVANKRRTARISLSREPESGGDGPAAPRFCPLPDRFNPYRLTLANGSVVTGNSLPVGPDRDELERALLAYNEASAPLKSVEEAAATDGVSGKLSVKEQLRALSSGDLGRLLQLVVSPDWLPSYKYRECGLQTALHVAAQHDRVVIAHVLLTAGASIDALDGDLCTPLMLAARRAQNQMVKYLVTAGAALDAKGEDGMTPLHLAAQAGNVEGCHYLLSSGRTEPGYVNQLDDGGWTAVVWASEHRHPAAVRYLLQRGADPRLCDEEQNTGLHWAAYSGSMEIGELFLAAGCLVNAANVHGDTPLHVAGRRANYECLLLLLAHDANAFLRNREALLALDCVAAEHTNCRQALMLNMELTQLATRAVGATRRRHERVLSNDVSHGKEKLPIQAVNDCDDHHLPLDYTYIASNCETVKLNVDRTITSLQSCNCRDNCLSSGCMCSQISLRCWYDPDGRLMPEFNYADPPMIFECNRACGCNQLTCNNRAVQHGITARVQLYRTPDRGWGVRALRPIARGTYVCEYVGELITDSAADQREDDAYLFDLDNRDGDTFCIDARRYGNVARFINHRCEPNLVPVKVFVDHQDVRFPRIALFACRDIEPHEELGFDYGEKFWMIKYKLFTCKCGSARCKYSSESIHTTLANYKKKQLSEAADSKGA